MITRRKQIIPVTRREQVDEGDDSVRDVDETGITVATLQRS